MGYLEIIGIGYLLNIAGYGLTIMVAVLNILVLFLTGSKLQIFEQSKKLNELKAHYDILTPLVPSSFLFDKEDLGMFFPFMGIFAALKFFYYSAKYGMNNYLIMKLEQKIYIMERWLNDNKDNKDNKE